MSFKSLHHIVGIIEKQVRSPEQQQLQRLLQSWPEVVGETRARQTRPLSIQNQVLRVATASAALAQTLTFERRRILQKLNPLLPSSLVDIRFSTAEWHRRPDTNPSSNGASSFGDHHPSWVPPVPPAATLPASPAPKTPDVAFQRWAQTLQARSQSLPLCPQCQCPTPPGELQRWSLCAPCAAKQWSGFSVESRSNQPGSP